MKKAIKQRPIKTSLCLIQFAKKVFDNFLRVHIERGNYLRFEIVSNSEGARLVFVFSWKEPENIVNGEFGWFKDE